MRQRSPRDKARPPKEKYRINEWITAAEVRLVGAEGDQLGVVSLSEAMRLADEAGMDLVEVSPNSEPPVCRVQDYGKLKYKEQKKAAEARKRTSAATVKEIRVSYRTDKHDLETKVRKARKFIEGGDKVRFQMRFRGREATYRDLGEVTFKNIAEALSEVAAVEEITPLLNQRMLLTLVPKVAKSSI